MTWDEGEKCEAYYNTLKDTCREDVINGQTESKVEKWTLFRWNYSLLKVRKKDAMDKINWRRQRGGAEQGIEKGLRQRYKLVRITEEDVIESNSLGRLENSEKHQHVA